MRHGVREQLGRRCDIGIDQIVVALVSDSGLPVADVHLVIEQLQIIGTHVEHDRDHPARVQAGGGNIDRKLANGDVDAADALVADAERSSCGASYIASTSGRYRHELA